MLKPPKNVEMSITRAVNVKKQTNRQTRRLTDKQAGRHNHDRKDYRLTDNLRGIIHFPQYHRPVTNSAS